MAARGSIALRCRSQDTDGFRENEYLGDKADPYQDTSARVRFTWEPNDNLTGDFRYARSDIETTALHFVINDDWRTLGGFVGVPNPGQYHGLTVAPADVNNVNYTGVPIRVNNPGEGLKDMDEVSMKFDVATDAGTFTSITAYDDLHELLTGDAFDFRPIGQSFNEIFFPRFQNPQQPAADAEPVLRRLEPGAVSRGQLVQPGVSVHVVGGRAACAGSRALTSWTRSGSSARVTCSIRATA